MDDLAVLERQLGRPPRAFRRVAVRCPFGAPAVVEQEPFDARRRAVPDAVLAHLPPPRRARSRGSRRPAGSSAGRPRPPSDPELAESLERAHAEQRELRPELPGGIGGATRDGQPEVPARARRVRARPARATSSATGSSPRPSRSGRERALLRRLYDRRASWTSSLRAISGPKDAARSSARATTVPSTTRLTPGVEVILAELTRRIGQIFTLEELAGAYAGGRPLVARGDRRRVPEAGAQADTSVIDRRGLRPLLAPRLRLRAVSTVIRPRTAPRRSAVGRGASPPLVGIVVVFVARDRPRRGAARQPEPGRDADARAHAPPAAARPGGPEHRHRHGFRPLKNNLRNTKLWVDSRGR